MININVNNIDLFQTMLTVLPENTKGHNYYQMISLFNNNFH